uniref:Uncharacterized protein n=1 Tax=Rhipicephalus microplus TaxID=6941 RepID=A0A6G5A0R5_RHIMP
MGQQDSRHLCFLQPPFLYLVTVFSSFQLATCLSIMHLHKLNYKPIFPVFCLANCFDLKHNFPTKPLTHTQALDLLGP